MCDSFILNKKYLTILFQISNIPFLGLAIFFNDKRNCQLYYTQFNLMDIIVTIFSAFYIIIEEREFKFKHRLVGRYIVDCINQTKQEEFDSLNRAYNDSLEDQKSMNQKAEKHNKTEYQQFNMNRRMSKFVLEKENLIDID